MTSPRIYLVINNCFASKRWTRPLEWMELIKDIGLNYVEASADNECDPLYMGIEYINDWVDEVRSSMERTGIKVVNLYSGHGTYTTLGLAHTDTRIRNRIQDNWLKPMIGMASRLDAGLGFFCHAFPDSTLQDREEYYKAKEDLYSRLVHLVSHANDNNVKRMCLEQMYSPHQVPWTIKETKKLLKKVYKRCNKPLYITIDTGHQTGQRRFLFPSYERIKVLLNTARKGANTTNMWLGSKRAYELFDRAVAVNEIETDRYIQAIKEEMKLYPYLFAEYDDGNPYAWLSQLACYSPIIHLQQTDGSTSSHYPFTESFNQGGIIFAEKILKAIKTSYDTQKEEGMPPKSDEIYLTLEIFSGTSDLNNDILQRLRESVAYWRKYVPVDGLTLDKLI